MTEEEIIRPENLVYKKPTLLNDTPMHYCPGCSHGVVHKLVAEVIEEMGMENKTVAISPVGCAVFAYNYIDVDWVEAAQVDTTSTKLAPLPFMEFSKAFRMAFFVFRMEATVWTDWRVT